jgi:hypothetical protein
MTLPFKGDLVRVRRNRLVMAATALPLALPALIAFATGGAEGAHRVLAGVIAEAAVLGAVVALLLWRANPWPRRDVVKVEADATQLDVAGTQYRREDLRDGFVVPSGGETKVVLGRRRASAIELLAQGKGEARRLLVALGFDASQTVARFRTLSRVFSDLRYLFAVAFIPFVGVLAMSTLFRGPSHGRGDGLGFLTFLLPLLLFALVALVPTRFTVGADGVEIRWFGRRRFIPHKDIVNATQYVAGWGNSRYTGVALWLESGEEVRIPIGQARRIQNSDDRTRMILERIDEAAAEAKADRADLDPQLLARGDRDVKEWLRVLRSFGAGANATMRTAPIEAEQLWRLVEDPGGEPVARAAAAAALTADPAAESRRRLRAAAEATAAPRLRVAIDAAANHDQDALVEALAELEADEELLRKKA